MSFDWQDYQNLAVKLYAQARSLVGSGQAAEYDRNTQALLRSAMSRAYYAAYHKVLDWAISEGNTFSVTTGGAHSEVITHCKKHGNPAVQELGQTLSDLKAFRIECDYYLTPDQNLKNTYVAVSNSKNIINAVNGFRNPSSPP